MDIKESPFSDFYYLLNRAGDVQNTLLLQWPYRWGQRIKARTRIEGVVKSATGKITLEMYRKACAQWGNHSFLFFESN